MEIGKDVVSGNKVIIPWKLRAQTHMHVIGASRSGKSKLLEHMIREDTDHGTGFCLIDRHGTLYQDVLEWLTYRRPDRDVILMNLSVPDYITAFNPFRQRDGDISALVSRHIDCLIKPWGMKDTNETPNLERICRMFFHFVAESGESIVNSAKLLLLENHELRDYALSVIEDSDIRAEWEELRKIKTPREWREQVMSTRNRLGRFLFSRAVRRVMGIGNTLDIRHVMDNRQILLVNLAGSHELPPDAAKTFAALLLSEFLDEAMTRAQENPNLYVLYLDEFQEYATNDMPHMLDAVLKGGLHLVLAHQRLGHLQEEQQLTDAITTNAKIKAVFGGLPYASALELANEVFLKDINEASVLDQIMRTTTLDHEVVQLDGFGWGESESAGRMGDIDREDKGFSGQESFHQTLKPKLGKEVGSRTFRSMEEKRSRFAEALINQGQGQCVLKLPENPNAPVQRTQVFQVRPGHVGAERVKEYERELYHKQGALTAEDADKLLALKEQEFLERATKEEEETYSKKKSAGPAEV